MNLDQLEAIRLTELDRVMTMLSSLRTRRAGPLRVLEVGAGTGWQARKLSENGYQVETLDLANSDYAHNRIFPITDYDGRHIPFAQGSFDVIYTSNVLEHIPHLREFQGELHRVLRPDGVAIHVVPTGTWRLWTTLAHYPFALRESIRIVASLMTGGPERARSVVATAVVPVRAASFTRDSLVKALYPHRHGEFGNALSEMFHFSGAGWKSLLRETGWLVLKVEPNRLFYTGFLLFGDALSLRGRRILSYVLGSSCHIIMVRSAIRNVESGHSA